MSKSDQWIIITVVVFILIHLSIWVVGFLTNKLSYLTAGLNLVAGLSIIVYWVQKQLRIEQHYVELREIIVLCFELLVIGCTVYSFISRQWDNRIRIAQYIFFGIHLAALLLVLIFMLTFKMNRLI